MYLNFFFLTFLELFLQQFEQINDEVLGNTTVSNEPVIEDVQSNDDQEVSNGLENFEMEEETLPPLFKIISSSDFLE